MLLTGTLGLSGFDTPELIALQRRTGVSHVASNSCPDERHRVWQTARMVGMGWPPPDRKCTPEVTDQTVFRLCCNPVRDAFIAAWQRGIAPVPILLGPVSFLAACDRRDGTDPVLSLPKLLPVYAGILHELAMAGCFRVQIAEPVTTAGPMPQERQTAMELAWQSMAKVASGHALSLIFVGGSGGFWRNLSHVMSLPMNGMHIDMVRGGAELPLILSVLNPRCDLLLGIVDGLNRIPTDIYSAMRWIDKIRSEYPRRRVIITPSTIMHFANKEGRHLPSEVRNILADLTKVQRACAATAFVH
ncbi:5-methyltetrahydropteroyltriglutamate--homocysteine methyltransferase [Komagataeibacter medellinensis]|uniref:5-methyltetrahydropteroyltriglutamate--homocysteine methyltransferase n=1 Tax=Komagataeibacter medellinensis TaxID=1177712 RepID=A0ABQ6VWF3_9PROT|nr:5-methyltetrahydropteroyltriglutamate--homocysteine methyltransferase [Komagataeibacter medellinensis]